MAEMDTSERGSGHWGLLGTLGWTLVIGAVFVAVQIASLYLFLLRGSESVDPSRTEALLEAAATDGSLLALSTIAAALICTPLILGIVKLKRGASVMDTLALRPVAVRALAQWLGVLTLFLVATDLLTVALGRPIVPPFMTDAYRSAEPVWLLWLALIVAAPIFEEIFFRGFLFRGLAASFLGPMGAVAVIALGWAIVHAQYDLYGIAIVFCMGLLLGLARAWSGSLAVPVVLHAASNAAATVETAIVS